MYPGSKSDQALDVFQQTDTADLPHFCPQKLPGDSTQQTLAPVEPHPHPHSPGCVDGDVLLLFLVSTSPGAPPAALKNRSPFLSFLLHSETELCSASGAAQGHPEVQRTAPNSQLVQPKAWV